ncbi:MAG: FAD-dependent oxidoreductase, partial [Pseudomonadota bacterium]
MQSAVQLAEPNNLILADVACPDPVVIVGAGPVGMHALRLLLKTQPNLPVRVYGDERYEPYDRVQLSGLLAGQHTFAELELAGDLMRQELPNTQFVGQRVVSIDPEAKAVTDSSGQAQRYRSLILATGSRPFVPAIVGSDLAGVYTFRDMADAEKLAARRVLSQHTVVLGAGLLGIEAARAMQRHNT